MVATAEKLDGAAALLAAWPAPAAEAAWARAARREAEARLEAMGAPRRRDEYWKFTDPARLLAPVGPVQQADPDPVPVFDGVDRLRLIFVDGVFDPAQSDDPALAGVEIAPLAEALTADIHWAREIFGALEARGQDPVPRPLAALNTARARAGLAIRVTGRAARPIHLIYRRAAAASDVMLRHLVRVEAGAEVTLLESGPAAARLNAVLEIDLAEGARLHHVRTQGRDRDRRAYTALFARLGAAANLKSFTLTANGQITRNESVIAFTGPDAHARVAGACVGDGDFHHDDTVFITHGAENCESRQVFKKVLRNGAVGVFQGKILVREGAQRTDGYQISQGLLLDETSQFLAKPELEIYADDVACSHGSTCGAVDETMLFYLTSRGIPRRDAQDLLVLAFLAEAVEEIEDRALADDVVDRLSAWLARRRG